MKTLVVYYSNTGSNRYLAENMARTLKCDIEAIRPRLNFFPLLMVFSLVGASAGIKSLRRKVSDYDRIILCGPIWMGLLVSPLRDFLSRFQKGIKALYFATCCASTDAAKNDKFGHGLVFRKLKDIIGNACVFCEAFPIGLVLPEDKQKDDNAVLNTRLSDVNFVGEIRKRFEGFVGKAAE